MAASSLLVLDQLKADIVEVLKESGSGIKVSSFWNSFKNKYRRLPDPKKFNLKSRSDILGLCCDIFEGDWTNQNSVLRLRGGAVSQPVITITTEKSSKSSNTSSGPATKGAAKISWAGQASAGSNKKTSNSGTPKTNSSAAKGSSGAIPKSFEVAKEFQELTTRILQTQKNTADHSNVAVDKFAERLGRHKFFPDSDKSDSSDQEDDMPRDASSFYDRFYERPTPYPNTSQPPPGQPGGFQPPGPPQYPPFQYPPFQRQPIPMIQNVSIGPQGFGFNMQQVQPLMFVNTNHQGPFGASMPGPYQQQSSAAAAADSAAARLAATALQRPIMGASGHYPSAVSAETSSQRSSTSSPAPSDDFLSLNVAEKRNTKQDNKKQKDKQKDNKERDIKQNQPAAAVKPEAAAAVKPEAAAAVLPVTASSAAPVKPPTVRKLDYQRSTIEDVASECITRLAESREYVSLDRIEALLKQSYSINDLRALNLRRIDELKCVYEHTRTMCKVNAYIQAFVKTRSICSLYELNDCMREFLPGTGQGVVDVDSPLQGFEMLKLGPLCKQPIVYDFFKVPQTMKDPYEISTADIMEHMRQWLTEKDLWTNRQAKLEEFMNYIVNKRGLSGPYELGIRIVSIPLVIQVLKKAQRDCGQQIRNSVTTLTTAAEKEITALFRRFMTTAFTRSADTTGSVESPLGSCAVRQEYLRLEPRTVANLVLGKLAALYEEAAELQLSWDDMLESRSGNRRKARQKAARKNCKTINKFNLLVNDDKLAMRLFQIAVCCSREEIHEQLDQILQPPPAVVQQQQQQQLLQQAAAAGGFGLYSRGPNAPPLPSPAELAELVLKYLDRCSAQGLLTLKSFDVIDRRLCEEFRLQNFSQIQMGGASSSPGPGAYISLVSYVLNTDRVRQFVEEHGGEMIINSTASSSGASAGHTARTDELIDFIRQCGFSADTNQVIDGALREHYRVNDVKSLGHGSLARLLKQAEKPSAGRSNNILYSTALTAKQASTAGCWSHSRTTGVHGVVSKEQALAALQSCPLLENLEDWTQWSAVFQPQHRDLKDFIQKNGGGRCTEIGGAGGMTVKRIMRTSVLALEVRPGVLVKLTCDTSHEQFETAALAGNAKDMAGHLVSLIAVNSGLDNTPLALLANHVRTALLTLHGKQSGRESGDEDSAAVSVVRFVLDCLTALPLQICLHVVNPVFLDALNHVVGQTKSKQLLLQQAKQLTAASCDMRALNRLHALGLQLGVREWAESFSEHLLPPRDCLEETSMGSMGGGEGDVIDVDSESEENDVGSDDEDDDDDSSDSDDDDDLVLSDDDDNDAKIDDMIVTKANKIKTEEPATVEENVTENLNKNLTSESLVMVADEEVEKAKVAVAEEFEPKVEVTEVVESVERMEEETNEESGNLPRLADDSSQSLAVVEPQMSVLERRIWECRRLIDTIRYEEFGCNVSLSEEGRNLVVKHQERLGRSLERLSKDLYSKDTHFVLELVQNADDNDYPQNMFVVNAAVVPSLEFHVSAGCITVCNNEVGFVEKNVRAVCDVGRTTKGKHKFGYIGQKGIGFKSVFRVTDKPEIHSNGFHICFDVHSDPLGYILPHWIGNSTSGSDDSRQGKDANKKDSAKSNKASDGKKERKREAAHKASKSEEGEVIDVDEEVIDITSDDDGIDDDDDEMCDDEVKQEDDDDNADDDDDVRIVDEKDAESKHDKSSNKRKCSSSGSRIISSTTGLDEEDIIEQNGGWMTRIVLPLKEEMKQHRQSLSLVARFRDIDPSLLLFLHRLRSIRVVNEMEGYDVCMRRRDVGGLTLISHAGGIDRWLVVKKRLDASKISSQAKSGVEVESTEIALAFPLPQGLASETLEKYCPPKQPVFAFLPVRSYGFRFIVQGDFDVPSSREEVDRDSMWNQWLRGEIHQAFLSALDAFKEYEGFGPVEAVTYFMKFVPLQDEILDFFRPVASNIVQLLQGKPCLPTQDLVWKLPSQLVLSDNQMLRDVIPASLLRECLALDYLHSGVASALGSHLIQGLGVRSLTSTDLIEVGKIIVARLSSTSPGTTQRLEAISQVSRWLVCVYRGMDEFGGNEGTLESLRGLRMIPLVSGEVVSVEERTVFFPLEKSGQKNKHNPMTELESDLSTVHSGLLGAAGSVEQSQLCKLLEQLSVRRLTPHDVIHRHILPVFKSEAWKTKSPTLLVLYVVYIHDQMEQNSSLVDMQELRNCIILLTNQGPACPSADPIHFTEVYLNPVRLSKDLAGYDWRLLDAAYLHIIDKGPSRGHIEKWREFFSSLGVMNGLSIKKTKISVSSMAEMPWPWNARQNVLPASLQNFTIEDFQCEELAALIKANSKPESFRAQMAALFSMLDSNWDNQYRKFTQCSVLDSQGRAVKEIDSSFGLALKILSWIPARIATGSQDEDRTELGLSDGFKLFVPTKEIRQLMSDHVSYLDVQGSTNRWNAAFLAHVGIRESINAEFVKVKLIEWCERDGAHSTPTKFKTTFSHIVSVYSYLSENLPPRNISILFQQNPVIFYSPALCGDRVDRQRVVDGVFLNSNEVRWRDPTGLFTKYESALKDALVPIRYSLEPIYSGGGGRNEMSMEEIMMRYAHTELAPGITEYAYLIVQICASTTVARGHVDVLRAFSKMGAEFRASEQRDSILMSQLQEIQQVFEAVGSVGGGMEVDGLGDGEGVVPCRSGRWVPLGAKPMVADDKKLEKLFSGCAGVEFVDFGEKLGIGNRNTEFRDIDIESVHYILSLVGVRRLTDCVEVQHSTENFQLCPPLQMYVRGAVPYIQRCLFSAYPDVYSYLVENDVKSKLKIMMFVQVNKLELVHRIPSLVSANVPEPSVVVPEQCRLIEKIMYVAREHLNSYPEFNRELARYFSSAGLEQQQKHRPSIVAQQSSSCFNEIRALLSDIHLKSQQIEDLMEERGFDPLPTSEAAWEVPEPIIVAPPRPPRFVPSQAPGIVVGGGDGGAGEGGLIRQEGDEASGLKSWPPQSNAAGVVAAKKHADRESSGAPQIWPPPAPPEKHDVSQLPANLRPSSYEAPAAEDQAVDKPESAAAQDKPATTAAGNRAAAKNTEQDHARKTSSASGAVQGGQKGERKQTGGGAENKTDATKKEKSEVEKTSGDVVVEAPEEKQEQSEEQDMEVGHGESCTELPEGQAAGQPEGQAEGQTESKENSTAQQEGKPDVQVEDLVKVQPEGQMGASGSTSAVSSPARPSGSSTSLAVRSPEGGASNSGPPMVFEMSTREGGAKDDVTRVKTGHKRARVNSNAANNDQITSDQQSRVKQQMTFYGPPVWLVDVDDAIYEHLGGATDNFLSLPDVSAFTSDDDQSYDTQFVGQWGELLVRNYLESLKSRPGSDIVEIIWTGESTTYGLGLPYDFVIRRRVDQSESIVETFIEVKSTRSNDRAFFEISMPEVLFAQEKGAAYEIYRVYCVGKPHDVRLAKISNVAERLVNKTIRLLLLI